MTLSLDPPHTNYERLRDIIRGDIMTGVLAPGSRLKIAELSERYGISAVPVREALQQLQGEGLIELTANRGASVRRIDETFLWQVYEIRKALETFFVVELAYRVTPADIEKLYGILAEQEAALAKFEDGKFQDLDRRFHNHIVSVTQNEEAISVLNRHYDLIRPLRIRFGRSADQRARIPREHREIIDAIQRRDSGRASLLLSAHIDQAFKDLAGEMQRNEEPAATRSRG
ncbi:GntR family transcriptional regulator [Bradyrhizobium canariense]|uniref:Transcriptional regulator, GntR family n=1 Tax=Bradyrhizobium canariense TaxID=255045 RepID=A0A1H1ZV79_9BRAD|nr:GntR family transcriptional regulator [Bradyrhizobium canariense]SDT37563.1 transcriptional regulator, GntR family [Bradyrhizobium canariense]